MRVMSSETRHLVEYILMGFGEPAVSHYVRNDAYFLNKKKPVPLWERASCYVFFALFYFEENRGGNPDRFPPGAPFGEWSS